MFGLIAAGRLVQTDFIQVDQTKCVIQIGNIHEINHLVIFLTGSQEFPPGYGGQVYFGLPDEQTGQQCWSLLGNVTNSKPSSIFKISNLKNKTNEGSSVLNSSFFGIQQSNASQFANNRMNAEIGISIEPLSQIEQSTPVTSSNASTVSTFEEFSRKMLENFMNYIASFSSGQHAIQQGFIPYNLVTKWYENFLRRLQSNPYFWRT